MKNQLSSLFPNLSESQLQALTWAGLEGTPAWAELSLAEQQSIKQFIGTFIQGKNGTRCNPM